MTVSQATMDSLRANVARAEREMATASPRGRTHAKLALQMARAALEDAEKEQER